MTECFDQARKSVCNGRRQKLTYRLGISDEKIIEGSMQAL